MINIHGDTWSEISKHLTNELASKCEKLESTGLSIERTEYLRGSISSIRKMLELPYKEEVPKTDGKNLYL